MDVKDIPCGKYSCVREMLESDIRKYESTLKALEIKIARAHELNTTGRNNECSTILLSILGDNITKV